MPGLVCYSHSPPLCLQALAWMPHQDPLLRYTGAQEAVSHKVWRSCNEALQTNTILNVTQWP